MIRNVLPEDIPKLVKLQEGFVIWHVMEMFGIYKGFKVTLDSFRQFCAQLNAVLPSASNLIIFLEPEYAEHKWKDTTADGLITNTNHNPKGERLHGADMYSSKSST